MPNTRKQPEDAPGADPNAAPDQELGIANPSPIGEAAPVPAGKQPGTPEEAERAKHGTGGHPLEAANAVGYLGARVDPTPNEHYTVAGRVADAPTPETDPGAWAAANVPAQFPGLAADRALAADGEAPMIIPPNQPAGRVYSADNPARRADVAAGRPAFGPTGGEGGEGDPA